MHVAQIGMGMHGQSQIARQLLFGSPRFQPQRLNAFRRFNLLLTIRHAIRW
jgi:hypothetical protein